ncbi:hypothetical protein FSP39_011229 [Pinctada imbricata]|uniref:Armadillo repeat-containing domain-containing protein n=1 Tax=Pinctada imbricata TaxID=66713 RepID=A0AA88YBV0_PINIB|nr:hypothetical protein FSP39_011229 [Pinctada imbricata]
MVSTLTTRAVTGGVVVSVVVAALYLLLRKKGNGGNQETDDGTEQVNGNSEKDDTGEGGGGGGRGTKESHMSDSLQTSTHSSMTHSFEVIDTEDVNKSQNNSGGDSQSDVISKQLHSTSKSKSGDEGDGKMKREPTTKPSHVTGVKIDAKTKTHSQKKSTNLENEEGKSEVQTSHHSEMKDSHKEGKVQKDGKKEKGGLSEVTENMQASIAVALNTTQLKSNVQSENKADMNGTNNHSNESGSSIIGEIDRKENVLHQDSKSRSQITKTETKVSSSEPEKRSFVQTNGGDSTSHPEQNHVQQQMPYEKFSQEDRTVAILVSQNSPGVVSSQNAEVLVSLLSHPDPQLKMAALTGINKCSSFTRNQNLLREHGCLHKLSDLLKQEAMSLKSANQKFVSNLALAVNNLSANEQNQKELKDCVPTLVDIALEDETGESICLSSLQALTNLSVTSDHHGHYTRVIQKLYDYVEKAEPGIKLQAAKVLVNLSCNPDLIPHMLAAKAPSCLLDLLRTGTDENMLLRWTTLLANILSTVKEHNLSLASLPPDDKAPSPETMYSALYGTNSTTQIKSKVFLLCRHRNENIKHEATRIYHIYQTAK